ncbi:MAG: YdcF family protein [Flavisolibacter sp.]
MFLLLKILLVFLRPVIWIAIAFIVALIVRDPVRKRKWFICGIVLFLVFSNPFIIRTLVSAYEARPVQLAQTDKFNTGIVLGGFVAYNKKDDKGYFNNACDRFIETVLLYKTGHISKIIVAAGNGYIVKHDFKEAEFIKQRLIEAGIPDTDILIDPYSRNTKENAADSKKIIDSVHLLPPYLLITSALHMPRASIAFKKMGIPVTPFPCDFSSKNVGNNLLDDYLLPSSSALSDWTDLIKELAGNFIYRFS